MCSYKIKFVSFSKKHIELKFAIDFFCRMCYNINMQITEFSKSGQNVKIYVDGEFWAELPYLIAFDFRLHKGTQVDDEILQSVLLKSQVQAAFDYSVWYLSRYSATVKKMKNKLYEKEYKKQVVNEVIQKLCELKYLDDFAYAQNLVDRKCGKLGKNRLKTELRKGGISDEIIAEVIGELDCDEQFDAALSVAKKWYRSHELETQEDFQKFLRFMAYRGFDYDLIKRCKEELKFGEDD